jgi:hypothetical protein
MFVSVVSLYTKTESFDVSIEPKQTETNGNSLMGSIFCFFLQKILGFSVFFGFFGFFGLFRSSLFRLFRFYTETELNKQKTHPNSLKESILVFFRKFRVVLVCFGYETDLFVSVVSI